MCLSGSWVEDLRQGHGVYTYPNRDTYDGDWLHHMRYHSVCATEIFVVFILFCKHIFYCWAEINSCVQKPVSTVPSQLKSLYMIIFQPDLDHF